MIGQIVKNPKSLHGIKSDRMADCQTAGDDQLILSS